MDECVFLSDECLIRITANTPKLQALRCDSNALVTDKGVCGMARQCPLLRLLGISYLYVSDTALRAVGQYCRYLEHLDMDYIQATHVGVQCVLQGCRQLRYMSCSNQPCLSRDALDSVCIYGRNLESLVLSHCNIGTVDVALLDRLVTSCPALTVLDIRGIPVVHPTLIPTHIWDRIHIVGDF